MEKATGAVNQVIIYAKHWYKKSRNGVVEDVRRILAQYSGTELKHESAKDAKTIIIYAFAEYVKGHDLADGILDALNVKWEPGRVSN